MVPTPAAIVERFCDAWNRHDMKGFGELFAPDSHFVNVFGIWYRNRAEIVAAHAKIHETVFRTSSLAGTAASVMPLGPDVAVVHMTWDLVGHTTLDDVAAQPRKGVLTFVLGRDGEGWLIRAAQNTDIVPPRL